MNKRERIFNGPSKESLFDALRLGNEYEKIGRVVFSIYHTNDDTFEGVAVKIEALIQLRNEEYKFAGQVLEPRGHKKWKPIAGKYCQGHYTAYDRKGWLEFVPKPSWLEE